MPTKLPQEMTKYLMAADVSTMATAGFQDEFESFLYKFINKEERNISGGRM